MGRTRTLAKTWCILWLASSLHADLPVPPQVLDPQTPAEAWNVIRLATANVSRLLQEHRYEEVPQQVALCSPALRTLARFGASKPEDQGRVDAQSVLAFRLVNDVAQGGMARMPQTTEAAFARLKAALAELQLAFKKQDVSAEIYACPQHPEVLGVSAEKPCSICQAPLRVRRIPYTDLYAKPEVPQVALDVADVVAPGPTDGVRHFEVRLRNMAGQPFTASSFLPLHGATLRLLLTEPTLTDFHILAPTETSVPGRYAASFLPSKTGSYRVWAEVVPAETALPEYPLADVGGTFQVAPKTQHDFIEQLEASVEGYKFALSFTGGVPIEQQVRMMRIHVSDSAGQPVSRLEPLMNAFAHLTGFYDDDKTVLRLHPLGGDVLREELRGGPWLAFKIYPPHKGFIRLFCQVRVDGRTLVAPLGLQISR
ncbi:MAG: hypothetical protein ACOYMN_18835 [Roseimicrobium sp.]